jgi:hypothetical protein
VAARKLRDARSFRLAILKGTDHIFTPRAAQERLGKLLTDHLVERFGGVRLRLAGSAHY